MEHRIPGFIMSMGNTFVLYSETKTVGFLSFSNLVFPLTNKELIYLNVFCSSQNLKKTNIGIDFAVRVKALHLSKTVFMVTGRVKHLPEEAPLKEASGKSQNATTYCCI